MPYYIAALFAAAAMAWYFFIFVPSKLEYFVGLRLRALAVATSQVKARSENLASALVKAPGAAQRGNNDTATYLQTLVPDIQLDSSATARQAGLHLTAPAPAISGVRTAAARPLPLYATVGWDDVMAQAAAVSLRDFDDLILALPNGEVAWQRETTTPRIGNLAQVMYADAPDKSWFPFSWSPRRELPKLDAQRLPRAVAINPVTLGGKANLLLVEAATFSADGIEPLQDGPVDVVSAKVDGAAADATSRRTVYVAGLVSQATLRQQAMAIPVAWVVLLALPVVLLFLALPFVKLETLMPRERFSFMDAILLLVATVVAASIAATIPLTETSVADEADDALSRFADLLERRMAKDVSATMRLAGKVAAERTALATRLRECRVKVESLPRCDLWAALGDTAATEGGTLDVDVVIWLDERGDQLDKWTTKAQVTGLTPHRQFQHFRDLTLGRLWRLSPPPPLDAGGLPPFTVEPLRAPTTAELGVVVGMPLQQLGVQPNVSPAPLPADMASTSGSRAKFLVVNVRPPSLLDAVVAPAYGFAIIAPDGKVLFHSDENLSLEENFFEEVGEPADVRAKAQSGHAVTWSGDYHGRPHRLHIQQVQAFAGSPWRIVTFRDMGPTLAGVMAHQSGTLRLSAINLAALVLFAIIIQLRSRLKRRDVRDLLNVRPIARPHVLLFLPVLVVAGAAVVFSTYVPATGQRLDWPYLFFLLLPFAAIRVSILARQGRPGDRAPESTRDRRLIAAELALLVVVMAALPAAGFARIVHRVQTSQRGAQWLEQTQQLIAARNARVQARLNGPAYPTDTGASASATRALLTTSGFGNTQNLASYEYLSFLPEVGMVSAEGLASGSPEEGQRLIRFLLGWNPFPSRDTAGRPSVTADRGQLQLAPLLPGSPALTLEDTAAELPDVFRRATAYSLPPAKLLFGILLLAVTIAGVYWARRKLLAYAPADAPSLRTILRCLPQEHTQGVMLIGPPRTHKDGEVIRALRELRAASPHRIKLLDSAAEPEFVKMQLRTLTPSPARWWRRAAALPEPAATVWIHVSNLETHLINATRRRMALDLLERLVEGKPNTPPRVIIVTTNVDPIAHFEEIFDRERDGIYEDPVPEVELSRFSLLLSRFRRCYLPMVTDDESDDPWWNYDPRQWRRVLDWETRGASLSQMSAELESAWRERDSVPLDELARAVSTRAFALYQLLWTSCTRREKLVLVQLAQEGFVTPQSGDVVAALMAKGLIIRRPGPTIFNYTFRDFLRHIERNDVVQEWERLEGHGLWLVSGRLIASSLAAGGLFFLLTQGYSVEGLLPVLSGTGLFGVPLVRNLVARFSGSGPAASATA